MFKKIYFKNLIPKKLELLLLAFFLIVRISSFFIYNYNLVFVNNLISFILIASFAYFSFKKPHFAWILLITELLLDGAGHFFEFSGLILRTWLLGIFALTWLYKKIKDRKLELTLPKPILTTLLLSICVIFFSTILGIANNHGTMLVLQDTILYFFLFLIFPALEFTNFPKKYSLSIIKVFIFGTAIFSFLTFLTYSARFGILHDNYYKWFRDIVGGKITDLSNNFFRIVLSEQLYIIPLLLIVASYLIKDIKNKTNWFLTSALMLMLIMNMSRIYFLALALGLLFLALKNNFKKWFQVSFLFFIIFTVLFFSLSFISSNFKSTGLSLVGVKIASVQKPKEDISANIRLAMLPDIKEKINTHPYFGSGLATQVSYEDPVTKKMVSRTQFDWGYLEMLAELGIVGSIIFLIFILTILYYLAKLTYKEKNPLFQGLFAGALSLFVINLTTPALFQGFGILYFVFIMKIISDNLKKDDVSLK